MPGAESQSQLIRDTYTRCGLDPIRDRPQYFEAHGTGTPAGDRKYIIFLARRLPC
jgi:acyl transferase domain-containing protein